MAVGQVIGRVAVKVLPDTSDFRRIAKRELEAIEKSLEVRIGTRLDMSGASRQMFEEIRKINARNRVMDSRKIRFHTTFSRDGVNEEITKMLRFLNDKVTQRKVKVSTDLTAATVALELDKDSLRLVEKELNEWRRDHSPLKIFVVPELPLGWSSTISARLAFLARPRTVTFIPVINRIAATKVAATLAALSGARVLVRTFDRLQSAFRNLDKNLPIIGSIAEAVAGLAGYAISAASNLFALSASLASIAGAAFALPGIFGGIAVGLGASIAVLKDFNEIIPEVQKQLAELQNQMSAKFWAVAEGPIRRMIEVLFPQLSDGLVATSEKLGTFFGNLAASLQSKFDGLLAPMFENLGESIDIASKSTDTFAGIIATLGQIGSSYLPRLATFFTDLTTQFDAFLTKAATGGQLQLWIDQGIEALKDLGDVLAATADIFSGIAQAAGRAGGSTLAILANTLERVAAVINSDTFQSTLTAVFLSAHQAMSLIAKISGPEVEQFFLRLGEALTTILPLVGLTIGTIFEAIASALGNTQFMTGLIQFFEGLKDGIVALAPALGPVGAALAVLGGVLGTLATALGPSLNVFFTTLANVLRTLAPAVEPLIKVLGAALLRALTALGPAVETVAGAFASFVAGGATTALSIALNAILPVIEELAPLLANVLASALKAIAPLLPTIARAFAQVATVVGGVLIQAMPLLAQTLEVAGKAFSDILTAVLPLVPVFTQLFLTILVPLLPVIAELAQALLPALASIMTALVPAIMPLVTAFAELVALLVPILIPALKFIAEIAIGALVGAFEGIIKVITGVVDIFQGLWDIIAGIFTGDWSRIWEGVQQVFQGAWDFIVGLLQVAWNVGVLGTLRRGVTALKGLWEGAWNGIKSFFSGIWNGIKSFFSSTMNSIQGTVSGWLSSLRGIFTGGWNNLKTTVSTAWTNIKQAVGRGIDDVLGFIKALPGRIVSALGNLGSLLFNAGKNIIKGLINGIKDMFGSVKSTLGDLTAKFTSWKGPESKDKVLLYDTGKVIIQGLVTGLESQYDAVRKSLGGLSSVVSGTVIDAPTIGGVSAPDMNAALASGLSGASQEGARVLNYYAAPGGQIESEEQLFQAAERARMGGW